MLDTKELFQWLPHRYPFLLVDRVTEVTPGESIRGFKNLTINEEFFQGHFPDQPVMPGVLMLEALAQLSGVLAFVTNGHGPQEGFNCYLTGVDGARFKRPVVPGDRLDLSAELLADRRGLVKLDCKAHVDAELACSATIMCLYQEVKV